MTARRVAAAVAGALAAFGVWIYLVELRYERSFYRRYLLEEGRNPQ